MEHDNNVKFELLEIKFYKMGDLIRNIIIVSCLICLIFCIVVPIFIYCMYRREQNKKNKIQPLEME